MSLKTLVLIAIGLLTCNLATWWWFILDMHLVGDADNFDKIITPLTGILTVVLGYAIWRDYGFQKKIKEKQFETVEKFVQQLKSMKFYFYTFEQGEMSSWTQVYVSRESLNSTLEYLEPEFSDLIVTINAENFIKHFSDLEVTKSSLYMPPELVKSISLPIIQSPFVAPTTEKIVSLTLNGEIINPTIKWVVEVNRQVTFKQFVLELKQNLELAVTWIEKHSNSRGQLHI